MKKIITTICIAAALSALSTDSKAQSIYSENLKQASFAIAESVNAGFSPGFAELFTVIDVRKVAAGTLVTWKISQWNNISHFDIQKSSNKKQFSTIGSIGANDKDLYSFTDAAQLPGPAYFRIKCVERDGAISYSNVTSAGKEQPSSLLIAYPMPANDELTVQHTLVAGEGLISIYTQEGNLVMSVPPCAGTMQTTMDLSYLKAGTYLLRVETGSQKVETLRIVKQ